MVMMLPLHPWLEGHLLLLLLLQVVTAEHICKGGKIGGGKPTRPGGGKPTKQIGRQIDGLWLSK
jgi:hypothetical protein